MQVALYKHELIQVDNAQKGHKYLCPFCHHRVIIVQRSRNGHRFFAHCCNSSDCGGESTEHLRGKVQIAHFFRTYSYNIKIEEYIPQIRQWPDILINDSTVIEFQCSPINSSTLEKRINGYLKVNLKSWWILGSPYYRRKLGENYLKRFMRYSPFIGFYLTFWLTKFNCLKLHYQIREVNGKILYRSKWIKTFNELNHFIYNNHLEINQLQGSAKSDLKLIQKRMFHQDKDTIRLQLILNLYNLTVDTCPLICHKLLIGPPIFKGKMLLWHIWILLLLQSNRSLEIIYVRANRRLQLPLGFIQVKRIERFYRQSFNSYIHLLIVKGYLIANNSYVINWQMPSWFRSCYDKQRFLNHSYISK